MNVLFNLRRNRYNKETLGKFSKNLENHLINIYRAILFSSTMPSQNDEVTAFKLNDYFISKLINYKDKDCTMYSIIKTENTFSKERRSFFSIMTVKNEETDKIKEMAIKIAFI